MEEQGQSSLEQTNEIAAPVTAPAPTLDPAIAVKLAELRRRINSGGGWFYWIAGLSIINSLVIMFHGKFNFVVGLGFTQIVDVLIAKHGGIAGFIGLLINLFVAGVYGLFGYCACQRMRWAFITGMVFYALDTLIFLVAKDVFGIAFHAFALLGIYGGLKADVAAKQIEEHLQRQTVTP